MNISLLYFCCPCKYSSDIKPHIAGDQRCLYCKSPLLSAHEHLGGSAQALPLSPPDLQKQKIITAAVTFASADAAVGHNFELKFHLPAAEREREGPYQRPHAGTTPTVGRWRKYTCSFSRCLVSYVDSNLCACWEKPPESCEAVDVGLREDLKWSLSSDLVTCSGLRLYFNNQHRIKNVFI